MNRRSFLAAAAALVPASSAIAQQHGAVSQTATFRVGAIVIEAPWTRATPGGAKVAGGFMTVRNTGTEPDRLVGGTFPHAPRVEVHEMAVTDGTMRMREVRGGIEIPPGGSIQLRPGGYHMMFMDLSQPVRTGAPARGTLVFQKAGSVEISYDVAPVGAPGPSAAGGHGMPRH
jgi:copper(I)-binding protein